jgi:hypothetical protein
MAHPSMAEIATAERADLNRLRQRAKECFYARAGVAAQVGSGIAIVFALSAPFVLALAPGAAPGLAAAAGAWIFITRFGLDRLAREWQLKGVRTQEAFDCDVLGVEPNLSLAPPLSPEEIHAAGRSKDEEQDDEDSWYPTRVQAPWPLSVLICQRSNAVWASRQHRIYSYCLIIAMIVWAAVGIVVTLAEGATLGEYLLAILLPSLPGVLDGTDLIQRHQWAADRREQINQYLEDLIFAGTGSETEIREVQDQLFLLRRDGAQVPDLFYHRLRPDYEQDMHFGAEQMIAAAPKGAG